MRPLIFTSVITAILALLFGVPWYTLVLSGNHWPAALTIVGTVVFLGAAVAFPVLMFVGHARRGRDGLAVAGDSLLGIVWVLLAGLSSNMTWYYARRARAGRGPVTE